MTRPRATLARLLSGARVIPFRNLESLLRAFGFELARIAGSHRIYVHPRADRPLSVQPDRNCDAKPYQVRQSLDMVEAFGLGRMHL